MAGTANWQNLSDAVELIRTIKPRSVLDVGCGFGRWGFLCREFLDIWEGRVWPEQWKVTICGVEAFKANITAVHRTIYSSILYGDFSRIYPQFSPSSFDLVILGDVLEHMTKEHAEIAFRAACNIGTYVLLVVPFGNDWPQGALYGNRFEEHKSAWHLEELYELAKNNNMKVSEEHSKLYTDYIDRDFGMVLFFKGKK